MPVFPLSSFYHVGGRLVVSPDGNVRGGLLSASGLLAELSGWADDTAPRTDRPVRFAWTPRWNDMAYGAATATYRR